MQLKTSRLKINRADKHIADLDVRIGALPHSDIATVEINPEGGNEVIKHDIADSAAVDDIAVIAGDAVNNLKCALDYAWLETISRLVPSAVSKFAKFPVYPTSDALESALREKQIHILRPKLFDLIGDKIKPYDGGNFAIWPIHRLDIRDKHRLLIPVVYYSSVSGIETEDERGQISRNGYTLASTQKPPYYIPIPAGWRVKNKGKVSVSVMFEYGPRGLQQRIVDSFSLYSSFVVQVVETLERFVEFSR
jgi:hypothetical protein